ncbi:hypothetical protein GOARA_043_00020 [Gordonia araii NBRC 100433]|uniref:Uncharacterized protein n=1 Tax=Gordonia araii NBRC 100433 TaxID=1073574 RepID=G7H167_9ACTN|nr:hypothetical protein [Gordonia araii]NNG96785.1 hypothetical protein [Gordonia araii NBRC 100433]GAB09527.1 hypothetical protein GOARA_043_00020 [Gordonia araii NBRC 100433]
MTPTTPRVPEPPNPTTTTPRAPMPAEPLPVPAPPGEPVQRSAQFGILPSQVSAIEQGWRTESGNVSGLDFSSAGSLTGDGSATFAAIRSVPSPAKEATDSIGKRLSDMADKLKAFNSRAVETDDTAAAGFRDLTER